MCISIEFIISCSFSVLITLSRYLSPPICSKMTRRGQCAVVSLLSDSIFCCIFELNTKPSTEKSISLLEYMFSPTTTSFLASNNPLLSLMRRYPHTTKIIPILRTTILNCTMLKDIVSNPKQKYRIAAISNAVVFSNGNLCL